MQGLRTKHDVNVRRAGNDRIPLLAGDATADANYQVGVEFLQVANPAEVVENLLLRLFAYRAGVEQDDVVMIKLSEPPLVITPNAFYYGFWEIRLAVILKTSAYIFMSYLYVSKCKGLWYMYFEANLFS